ncbi:protein PALE CRESS, chloroplastic isoform X1 [Phragmites australis]|uniref:protein PALE CRESS, chloroplastic isoform X1 n=1 Tax=Phragmites australis TaxID=29695 RepID=UPI002D79F4EC|nr:protein PALE CRESS, chloroplastic isoform X1 [Phragmites australis]
MAAAALALSTFLRPRPVSPFLPSPDSAPHVRGPRRPTPSRLSPLRLPRPLLSISAVEKTKAAAGASEEGELEGMPPEFYDEEWQAGQRERTKEWHTYRQKEEAEEEKRTNEYREIGMRLKAYPQEEVCKARILVSIFIRAGEDVEEEIEKAAERGELTELVLMVIWNRLDVARRDDERDVIRSLDLLYRRVETEILKSEATPSMKLLDELLNLHDGVDDDKWLKKCRKRMLQVFPREDPFTIVFPAGFNLEKHEGRIELPPQDDDVLLRVDFVREVDELLKEVKVEQEKNKLQTGYDPESVVTMLKQQEKLQAIRQVESLLELASSLKW